MTIWRRCDRKFGPLIAERQSAALAAGDAAALDRHLHGCGRCRAWARDLRELAEGLGRAAEVAPLDHPDPELLATLAGGGPGLSSGERARLERHLEACQECKAEWNVATSWSPVALPAINGKVRPAVPVQRWGWFAGGALSTAAAAALLLFALLPGRDSPSGLRPTLEPAGVPVQIRGAHHRAVADATTVRVAAGAGAVVVSLTVEAAPGSRLSLDMVAADGRSVLAGTDAVLHEASGLLLFSVPVAELPEAGEFHVTVGGTEERFRYPFRVEREDD